MAAIRQFPLPELEPEADPELRQVTIGTLMAAARRGRRLRKVDLANALDVDHTAISGFEAGDSSDTLAIGYVRKLALTDEELNDVADRLAGTVTADLYDKRRPPLERALVNGRYQRAGRDGYAKRAMTLAREKCPAEDSNPGCDACGRPFLTAIDGRQATPSPFQQLNFFPLRSE